MPTPVFFTILDSVDSTNNYAMGRVHAGLANDGMAWFAKEQTGGKGQRGKQWETEAGKNITLSIALQTDHLKISQQFYLSMAVALGCFDFFNIYADSQTKIKWPNDIYWGDRKAGGVLIETIYHGTQWKWAVVGIGININQGIFNAALKNPVSLTQITGKEYDVIELAKKLHEKILARVARARNKSSEMLHEYNQLLYKRGEKVRLRKGNIVFETEVRSVNEQGRLITFDTMERQFDFGEVEWVLL